MTREEVMIEISTVNRRISELELKLDNYFSGLHEENSNAIDEILIAMLETEEGGESNV